MILELFVIALVASCNGDVSHLETDLKEDGYHYKQPPRPFESDDSGLDNQLDTDVAQQSVKSELSTSIPSRPAFNYLPPSIIQPVPQSAKSNGENRFSSQSGPGKEYGPPTTFSSKPPTSFQSTQSQPQLTYLSSPKPTNKETAAVKPQIIQKQISSSISPKPILRLQEPKKEYLPPHENEISPGPNAQQIYPLRSTTAQPPIPGPQTTNPTQNATYSLQKPTNQIPDSANDKPNPTYSEPQSTSHTLQSTHFDPESTYTELPSTFPSPQPTYSELQTANSAAASEPEDNSSSGSEEPESTQQLGPDGYKYKTPSKSFKY